MSSFSGNSQMDKLAQGDDDVIKLLYTKVLPKVVTYVNNNKGKYEDAEEIFQKALFEIIVRIKVTI